MITVVIPTIGRPTLRATLAALDPGLDVIVVDDRPEDLPGGLPADPADPGGSPVKVIRSGGRGPAAARNAGWRAARTPWVAFLDDDVVPGPGWAEALRADLESLPEHVAGSQGRLEVPLPEGRRPTDAERTTAGLAGAHWITADMAYNRSALERVGGFDERFPRAYREDADLALRLLRAGFTLVRGNRTTVHPVRDDGFWASVRAQRGNADDALMRRVHGPGWRAQAGAPRGRLRRHLLVTALGAGAAAAFLTGLSKAGRRAGRRRRTRPPGAAHWTAGAVLAAGWAALTAEFAWARIAPGPRTRDEVLRMVVTSLVIPPAACVHRLRGEIGRRR
ncbi:glycosyltransferase family 2 protein [Microtetraspora niveoalba]|uniref:glycosyltransferase family 2 protein n=1 Tax=Microtetraspora niveoalba TaxID=46175 RepID=UPI000830CD78|nr:glycosyltransferase [Microtetraspora niveoalba]